ncbi:hypothetical protein KAOT1_14342 [Kordia algicida OT-1]|uniref:Glutaredoxin domain-containing protein n=2 Tax=Kordia TaxID=221065 RepID=A9DKU6_9FLAO|nr:hypothetical protein KAOT1_14342 [Kordia algicida OT-1]
MKHIPKIKLYGTKTCHKTNYYKTFLDEKKLPYQFLDVLENENHADELRNLYTNKKLNFPTIIIGNKKLRNPREAELHKWFEKLIHS